MVSNGPIDIAGELRNPNSNFELTVHDSSFTTEPFTSSEAELFETQLNDLVVEHKESAVTELFNERSQTIANTAAFAKSKLNNRVFGGVNAGDNQVGFSNLRAGHIRADPATGNAANDWYFDYGAGWQDWIGDGAANNQTIGEDQVTVILGMLDQDVSTEISGLNVESWGRNMDMLPHDLTDLKNADNEYGQYVKSLPTLVAQENDNIHIRLRADRAMESQPRLLGLTFGVGTFLNTEEY
jgi:hypothetical protein